MARIMLVWASLALGGHGRRSPVPGSSALADFLLSSPPRSQRASQNHLASLLNIRGGADLEAALKINELASSVFESASLEVLSLREGFSGGEPISGFGAKADKILDSALAKFNSAPKGDAELYEKKLAELQKSIMNMLNPVFAEQICILKGIAMDSFLKALSGDGDGAEAMISAESQFSRDATASMPRAGWEAGWSFTTDRKNLLSSMQAIVRERSKATEAQLRSSESIATAITYLQQQQQQMHELQEEAQAQGGPWSFGAAYRPPDTDINLSTAYQNGRCNVQISMVPDEGAHLLGPNGFTRGMGPANLGLSFNVHL